MIVPISCPLHHPLARSSSRSLVAFGSKAPEFYGPWNDPVPEISKLEQELHRRAEGLRAKAERVGQKEDEQVFVRLGVQRPDLPPAGLSKSKEYPPAPPGWDEATTVSYEDRCDR